MWNIHSDWTEFWASEALSSYRMISEDILHIEEKKAEHDSCSSQYWDTC